MLSYSLTGWESTSYNTYYSGYFEYSDGKEVSGEVRNKLNDFPSLVIAESIAQFAEWLHSDDINLNITNFGFANIIDIGRTTTLSSCNIS